MKGLLDGKSRSYIMMLETCVEKFMKTDPAKIKFFVKYADASTGMIKDRIALLRALDPSAERFRLIVQRDTLATYLLINRPDQVSTEDVKELLNEHGMKRVIVRELDLSTVLKNVDKFKALLWVKQRDWHTTVTTICFFSIAEGLLYLRELDESGYAFDRSFNYEMQKAHYLIFKEVEAKC